ncbi:CHC2 zinc finger domain-containing protein [bacterium]|nr:CHC2 zinc finger domain-containing protein [bacterium]
MSGRPIDAVLARLKKLKRRSENSWTACCPAHDDRNPSLSVSVGDDGRVLLNCFSGCSSDAVRAALGLEWRDLYAEPVEDVPRGTRSPRAAQGTPRAETAAAAIEPPPTGRVFASLDEVRDAYRRQLGEPSATWHYRDAGGDALGEVLRWETKTGEAETGKTIRPAFRFVDGWRMTFPPVRPLFGIDSIHTEDRVFVVEGEKAAERLHALGFPAVTSPGGSKAAGLADWSALEASEVVVLPDADDAGEAYAADVVEQLARAGREVVIARLPKLRPQSGDDIVEWIDDVHAGDEVAAAGSLASIASDALWSHRRSRPTLSVSEVLDDPAWSKPPEILRTGVPWYDDVQPFGGIERGTLTVLAAPPRCFKTSVMLLLGWQLAVAGHRVHYLAGEMTRAALVRRIVAMAAEVSPSVVSDPRDLAIAARVAAAIQSIRELKHRLFFGRAPITLEGIAEAADTADIVFVDYLQLVQPDADHAGTGRVDELDAAMRSILATTQQGATVFAAAAMNRVGRDTPSLGSIRGSSAIEYGATTVYAATESLVGIDPDADGPPQERISVEYRCVKQREGEAVPLRFDLTLTLGPLPVGSETK